MIYQVLPSTSFVLSELNLRLAVAATAAVFFSCPQPEELDDSFSFFPSPQSGVYKGKEKDKTQRFIHTVVMNFPLCSNIQKVRLWRQK